MATITIRWQHTIIAIAIVFLVIASAVRSCYYENASNSALLEASSYKAERDSLMIALVRLRADAQIKTTALQEAKKDIVELEKGNDSIHRWYNKVIERLKEKTPQEIVDEFEDVYTNEAEDRVVAIAVGQARKAVETNIEKQYAQKRLHLAELKISKIQSVVVLQDELLKNKDNQIAVLEQRNTINEKEYQRIIKDYEKKYQRQLRVHQVERVAAIGVIVVLTVITVVK